MGLAHAGHPEYGETPGIEVTTGPLGQGLAEAVGLAIAEKHMAAVYNHEGAGPSHESHTPVNHFTYVMCGDGDLMEGVSHESCSLAGTLGLGKLILMYDDNLISLDGPTELSFTEDVTKRFEAYHWHVQMVEDGNDLHALETAILAAKAETTKPSLIRVRTVIGYGSPKAGTNKAHGEALGPEATKATKKNLGFPEDKSFYVPEEARRTGPSARRRARRNARPGRRRTTPTRRRIRSRRPSTSAACARAGRGLGEADSVLPGGPDAKPIATRNAGQTVMNAIAKVVPELFGGAADLTSSTKTIFKDSPSFHVDPKGRNVFFGVREFGMMAAVNGIAAHGGLIPFGSTFFTFSDYCRSALRMGALQSSHSLYIFTHDSIGLGEDGPTHQPIEHLMALRAIPQLTDFRPADANETAACWQLALERKTASFMALSRQDLPVIDADKFEVKEGARKGAYVLEAFGTDLILVATGSEVAMVRKAAEELKGAGIMATVVSMPSFTIFEEQDEEYKMSIFPHGVPKISLEAGATMGWWKYIGRDGVAIGLDRFGASAPAPLVQDKLGISASAVVDAAKKLLKK